jgi:hypothetical protein
VTDHITFPILNLADWRPTRNTLHIYSRLLGKIRQSLSEPLARWWHISLLVSPTGLTAPIKIGSTSAPLTLSLTLDLIEHKLAIVGPDNTQHDTSLIGQSPRQLMEKTLSTLKDFGVEPVIDQSLFESTVLCPYDRHQAAVYFQALTQIHQVFQEFKAALPGQTSPVQLWPHHFDLSLEWFSGREVPGAEEEAAEQIGFGFSTGDESMSEPYFYANPWPFPGKLIEQPLPPGTSWHTSSWQGGLCRYPSLVTAETPAAVLRTFLETVYQHCAVLMK